MWTVCRRYVDVRELYNFVDERDFVERFVDVAKRLHTHH